MSGKRKYKKVDQGLKMTSSEEESSLDMECDDDENDPSYKKEKADSWSHEEIVALLSVWKRYVAQLDRASHKKSIYEKMSFKLISQLGVNRDRVAVQEMITKMKGLYKKNMPSKPSSKSKWRYWRAVDEILGEPDSEEESYEEEEADELDSTEEEVAEILPPVKKPRGRPSKAAASQRGTPPKKRKLVEKLPKTPKIKKTPPRDEKLEMMLAQDKEYSVMLKKLNTLFQDTTKRVIEMQLQSNNNILFLATNLQEYMKSSSDDNGKKNQDAVAAANLASNSLLQESPYGVLPSTNTSGQALMPFLRSVIGQITSQKTEQNL